MPKLDLTQFEGHTPGPWAMELLGGKLLLTQGSAGPCVAILQRGEWPGVGPGGQADRMLIKQAPALLARVEELEEEIDRLKNDTFAVVRDMAAEMRPNAATEALQEIMRNVELWKSADNMAGRLHRIAVEGLRAVLNGKE